MSFINDLRRRATRYISNEVEHAGDIAGETAMDVNYDPNQTFTSPFFGKKEEILIQEEKNFNLFLIK
jgi:hypothetical protein